MGKNKRTKKSKSSSSIKNPLLTALKQYYHSQLTIQRLFYPNEPMLLHNCYIHLSISSGPAYQQVLDKAMNDSMGSGESPQDDIYEYTSSLYGCTGAQMSFSPAEIIPAKQVGSSKERRVLILGAAGIGKSTLSEHLCSLWASGELPPKALLGTYGWVFRIPIRHLTVERYPKGTCTLLNVIEKECLMPALNRPLNDAERKNFRMQFMEASQSRSILFILDGFDEVSDDIHTAEYDSVLSLLKTLLKNSQVVLTTRPYNLYDLRHDYGFKEHVLYEVTGFRPVDITTYTQHFFDTLKKPEESKAFLAFLDKNPHAHHACRIPIHLELLCSAWEKNHLPVGHYSMTAIYNVVTNALCRRYLKRDGLPVRNMTDSRVLEASGWPLAFLDHLGYDSAQRGKLFLKIDVTERYIRGRPGAAEQYKDPQTLIKEQKAIGFIRPNNPSGEYDGASPYYFHHLTFRDYFAARFLVACLLQLVHKDTSLSTSASQDILHQWPTARHNKSLMAFLERQRFTLRYESIIGFMVGLLDTQENRQGLLHSLSVLLAPGDKAEIGRLFLVIRSIDEIKALTGDLPARLWQYITDWLGLLLVPESALLLSTLQSALIQRLKIHTALFQQSQVQSFFCKAIAVPDNEAVNRVLDIFYACGQPLPPRVKAAVLDRIQWPIEEVNADFVKVFTSWVAHLTQLHRRGWLPLSMIQALWEETRNGLVSQALAIGVFIQTGQFPESESLATFQAKMYERFCDVKTPLLVRCSAAFLFASFHPLATFLLLQQQKGIYIAINLGDCFNHAPKPNANTAPLLKAIQTHSVFADNSALIHVAWQQGIYLMLPAFFQKAFASCNAKPSELGDKLVAFHGWLMSLTTIQTPTNLQVKDDMLKWFRGALTLPCLENKEAIFLDILRRLHEPFPVVVSEKFATLRQELIVLLTECFNDIKAPTIKKYVAVFLGPRLKSFNTPHYLAVANTIIQHPYSANTVRQLLYSTWQSVALNTFDLLTDMTFSPYDLRLLLPELEWDTLTYQPLSAFLLLNKTPTESIIDFALRQQPVVITRLMGILIARYIYIGKALFFNEEGLCYFEYGRYQTYPLTLEKREVFEIALDNAAEQGLFCSPLPRIADEVIKQCSPSTHEQIKKEPSVEKISMGEPEPKANPWIFSPSVLSKPAAMSGQEPTASPPLPFVNEADTIQAQQIINNQNNITNYHTHYTNAPDSVLPHSISPANKPCIKHTEGKIPMEFDSTKKQMATLDNDNTERRGELTLPFKRISEFVSLLEEHERTLTEEQRTYCHCFESALQQRFINEPCPQAHWVSAYILLGVTRDKTRYHQVLSGYLHFLKKETLVQPHHWTGLIHLLQFGSHEPSEAWLTASHFQQIWAVVKEKSLWFDPCNQSLNENRASLALCHQLLMSFEGSGITLKQEDKIALEELLAKYKEILEDAEDTLGLWQVRCSKQALLRIKDTGPAAWQRSAGYLLAAGQHSLVASGAAMTGLSTYGLTSLGAIPSALKACFSLGKAGFVALEALQKSYKKHKGEEWYPALQEVQAAVIGYGLRLAYTEKPEKAQEAIFNEYIAALCAIDPNNKKLNHLLAMNLLGPLTALLRQLPGERYTVIHGGCVSLLHHYLQVVKEKALRVQIFEALLVLMEESGNPSVVAWCLQLANTKKNPLKGVVFSEALIQGLCGLYRWSDEEQQTLLSSDPEETGTDKTMAGLKGLQTWLLEVLAEAYDHNKIHRPLIIAALYQLLGEQAPLSTEGQAPIILQIKTFAEKPGYSRYVEQSKQALQRKKAVYERQSVSLLQATWMAFDKSTSVSLPQVAEVVEPSKVEEKETDSPKLSTHTQQGKHGLFGKPSEKTALPARQTLFGQINTLVAAQVIEDGFMYKSHAKTEEEAKAEVIVMQGIGVDKLVEHYGKHVDPNAPITTASHPTNQSGLFNEVNLAYISQYMKRAVAIGTDRIGIEQQSIDGALTALDKILGAVSEQKPESHDMASETKALLYDVPADGGCLFYSAALSVLLPYIDNVMAFEGQCRQLSGDEALSKEEINIIRDFLQKHRSSESCSLLSGDTAAEVVLRQLINITWRNNIVDYMEKQAEHHASEQYALIEALAEENHRSVAEYFANMRLPKTWGGEPEIHAMAQYLERVIDVYQEGQIGNPHRYGETFVDEDSTTPIQLYHSPMPGGQENIHYQFYMHADLKPSQASTALLSTTSALKK